jgi:signal transduction histidine kinase
LRPVASLVVDWLLIVGMVGYAAGYLLVTGTKGTYSPAGMLVVLAAIGGCLLLSRRNPALALGLTAVLSVVLIFTFDPSNTGPNAPDGLFAVLALMIYRLAVCVRPVVSALAVSVVAVVLQGSTMLLASDGVATFNPFLVVGTAGPWALGLAVRLRTKEQDELQARRRELEAEQARYVEESVRYERTRIARELHDIVAHNVSLVVVQASAGHYLASQDASLTAETFDTIADFARRAEIEISRVVTLLEDYPPPSAGLTMIDELLNSAGASGLAVTYRLTGAQDPIDAHVALIAYRVVQEAITNALKHAPGARITVTVAHAQDHVAIQVGNGAAAPGDPSPTLTGMGGGHGLDGLRERVTSAGGVLTAGPSMEGWRLTASLPCA